MKLGQFEVSELLTDEMDIVKYDVLYSLADQPQIKETDIDKYFIRTTEKVSGLGNALNICRRILCSTNFMLVN